MQPRERELAREIMTALGGYTAFASAMGVPYRRAYEYVENNSIPAKHDLKLVAALAAVGSEIGLLELAEWRAGLVKKNRPKRARPQVEVAKRKSRRGGQTTPARATGAGE